MHPLQNLTFMLLYYLCMQNCWLVPQNTGLALLLTSTAPLRTLQNTRHWLILKVAVTNAWKHMMLQICQSVQWLWFLFIQVMIQIVIFIRDEWRGLREIDYTAIIWRYFAEAKTTYVKFARKKRPPLFLSLFTMCAFFFF